MSVFVNFVDELPLLDERRCTGCGDCIHVCPTECLERTATMPVLVRPTDCVSCSVCAWACPTEAIQMAAIEEI